MNPTEFRTSLRLTVITPILLLGLFAGVLVWQVTYTISALSRLNYTNGIISDTRLLMRLILDMETGVRGFQVTGDENYLEPFHAAQPRIGPLLAKLNSEFVDPSDISTLGQLGKEFDAWQRYSEKLIDLRRSNGNANDPQINLQGKQMMDSIRAMQERLVIGQEQLRDDRAAEARRASVLVLFSVGLLTLLLGVVIGVTTHKRILRLSENYERHLGLERKQAGEALRNRQWLLTTLQSMGEGVVATDNLGQIQFMNPVAEQLTGWTQAQAAGKGLRDIFLALDENTHEPIPDVFKRLDRDQQSGFANHTLLRSRSGKESFIDHSASAILDEQGASHGIVLVFRDVTQRKRSDDALRSSERLALMGRLSATIAHEIRNPLDSVANLLYLLRRSPRLDSEGTEFLKLAEEELSRVAQITKQLLSFNREARKPVDVDIAEIVEGALSLFKPKLETMKLKLFSDFADRPKIIGLPGELRQVISNLLLNSMEASQQGGLITVRLKRSHDWHFEHREGVRIFVCDTGSGIPVEARKNLFQPFFTTKGERGTGLGLWVSRGIVEKHGGNMKFRTSTAHGNSGTCFNIFLPYEPNFPASIVDVA